MVLYYLGATKEPADVRFPGLFLGLHHTFKNLQGGMMVGCGLGALLGFLRPGFSRGTMLIDTTRCMGVTAGAGLASGFPYSAYAYSHLEREGKQKAAFKIQKSCWHNRLDLFTLGGLAAGFAVAPTTVWTGFLEFMGAEALGRAGCILWCGFGGLCFDFPAVLTGVLYYAHVDDIDVSMVGGDDDE
ncbi:unnamed protein product [Amoebophrya sp. A120]|nr:unnamed protein product [Amoebophrya sp. A120]|eukprot:GSA120T00003017001.1